MSKVAIRVDGLGKRYRIGAAAERHGSLREALAHAARAPFRNLKRLRHLGGGGEEGGDDVVWALRDVSFEVPAGQAVGIIGRNGAGKSTLLKVLSRITDPSAGRVEVHGRVGSLLEVGTGFHPELSGRENVYLNGSILGMDRAYIARKFDEIVSFSGVEKYIDTPVKRYSSGMYLRLAFAVAAHLEPEILIVDEVLAVGDMEFQKKCLGKMGEVTGEGRTVLFVSHNMAAVAQLTNRCIVLSRGGCEFDGPTAAAVQEYFRTSMDGTGERAAYRATAPAGGSNRLLAARVHTSEPDGVHYWGEPITFEFDLEVSEPQESLCFAFQVVNEYQQPICHLWMYDDQPYRVRPGVFRLRCEIPKFRLYMGAYTLTTWLAERRGGVMYENLEGVCPFEVSMHGARREQYEWVPGTCTYLEDGRWGPARELDHAEALEPAAGCAR